MLRLLRLGGVRAGDEEGFGTERFCSDTPACVARHGARTSPRPAPEHLTAMRAEAMAARDELAAMTSAAAAYARDCGRLTDEILMLSVPAVRPPARAPAPVRRKAPARRPPARRSPRESGPGPAVLQWLD